MAEKMADSDQQFIFELEKLISSRRNADPQSSYTSKLLNGPVNRLLQKVGEESVEFILEAKGTDREKIISEASDLLYHFMVSLEGLNLSFSDVIRELHRRHSVKK